MRDCEWDRGTLLGIVGGLVAVEAALRGRSSAGTVYDGGCRRDELRTTAGDVVEAVDILFIHWPVLAQSKCLDV